ncbi:signal peptide containing protein [Theileria equi strain WA]|uniref:Signal peptide containing protein n=1 Tax=Theileria equi strain WA TaxID=1537102 RepID=L1LBE3_THEEQ|nr:signal peptide containing protein [Theileria equi strain WA]EKX72488.1 signal peptide containing protein [Theileria equi strain WA]|eukprot:XP_004831940.1 signal peptide containing protein [Theileria equi strain WA]
MQLFTNVLVWHFFAILIAKYASTSPFKERVPLDVDTSCEPVHGIGVVRSEQFPGARYYYVRTTFAVKYRIGLVAHGNQILLPGNDLDFYRIVFYRPWADGRRYVRVVTKTLGPGYRGFRVVYEFYKGKDDQRFKYIYRTCVDLDLLDQEENHIIKIDDMGSGAKRFHVQSEKCTELKICVVKYGRYTLDKEIEGLIDRNVIWEGGILYPTITIISRYNNGTCVATKYKYAGIEDGFVLVSRQESEIFLGPSDEKIVVK